MSTSSTIEDSIAAAVSRAVAPLVAEVGELRAALHALRERGEGPIYLGTRAAAALIGTTPAGLRMRARRSSLVAGARLDARTWSREKLLAAVAR